MDTTAEVVAILSDALDVPVSTEVPMERPRRLVAISLEGCEDDGFFIAPRYSLMCWGQSDVDAHGIAMSALHALTDAAAVHPYLSDVRMETMARDEWGATGQARYQLVIELLFNTDETD